MNHFFITGLPRSRTAWFSNFLTFGNSFCWHDGFDGLENFEGFKVRMNLDGCENVGNSDPANLLFWREISFWYPKARWVVIRRPFEEVVKSCSKFGIDRSFLEFSWGHLIAIENALDPLVVKFDDLDFSAVDQVADWLHVKVGPPTRTSQLCRMNIQVEHNYLRERISENVANPPRFLTEALA